MWHLLRPKRKVKIPTYTIEETLEPLAKEYAEKRDRIKLNHTAAVRNLRETYEKKVDENRSYEKALSLQQILQGAESGTHPLEYAIETGTIHYRKVTFFRSKQSPNPYRITIERHQNCVFLGVTNGSRESIKDDVITLYYDKVKKSYREQHWGLTEVDFATKHHIRMFLYQIMKHVDEDTLTNKYYKNEYRASQEFWTKEHVWHVEYQQQVKELEFKRDEELQRLKTTYERQIAPYLKEKARFEEIRLEEEAEKAKKREEQARLLAEEKQRMQQAKQQFEYRVFDEQVDGQMKDVFRYAQELLKKEHLLQVEQAHELRRLYEKDLQELWRSFVQLDEKKQKQENPRFQQLLTQLERHLLGFEERMLQVEQLDYEKKMRYMERKYLS